MNENQEIARTQVNEYIYQMNENRKLSLEDIQQHFVTDKNVQQYLFDYFEDVVMEVEIHNSGIKDVI